MQSSYEETAENIEGIPLNSRRSKKELDTLEFLKLREEIEDAYKLIREKKRRIEELLEGDASLRELDSSMRKIPRRIEELREARKGKRKGVPDVEAEASKQREKKLKNAIKRKKQEHRDYLKQGYTMTEKEIRAEGGEVGKQYVYFKDMGDGKSSTHVIKGIQGLKLSSTLGEHEMEEMED